MGNVNSSIFGITSMNVLPKEYNFIREIDRNIKDTTANIIIKFVKNNTKVGNKADLLYYYLFNFIVDFR